MIRHLTAADYKTMPWANGKGVTVEMLRVDANCALKWRLSRASVVENGAFSIFPGIERNLTVITGPGFDLVGDKIRLAAVPLVPIAFAGDVPLWADGVSAPSDDFNVMTARNLAAPQVCVIAEARCFDRDGTLAVFALGPTRANDLTLERYELAVTDGPVDVDGRAIVVRLLG